MKKKLLFLLLLFFVITGISNQYGMNFDKQRPEKRQRSSKPFIKKLFDDEVECPSIDPSENNPLSLQEIIAEKIALLMLNPGINAGALFSDNIEKIGDNPCLLINKHLINKSGVTSKMQLNTFNASAFSIEGSLREGTLPLSSPYGTFTLVPILTKEGESRDLLIDTVNKKIIYSISNVDKIAFSPKEEFFYYSTTDNPSILKKYNLNNNSEEELQGIAKLIYQNNKFVCCLYFAQPTPHILLFNLDPDPDPKKNNSIRIPVNEEPQAIYISDDMIHLGILTTKNCSIIDIQGIALNQQVLELKKIDISDPKNFSLYLGSNYYAYNLNTTQHLSNYSTITNNDTPVDSTSTLFPFFNSYFIQGSQISTQFKDGKIHKTYNNKDILIDFKNKLLIKQKQKKTYQLIDIETDIIINEFQLEKSPYRKYELISILPQDKKTWNLWNLATNWQALLQGNKPRLSANDCHIVQQGGDTIAIFSTGRALPALLQQYSSSQLCSIIKQVNEKPLARKEQRLLNELSLRNPMISLALAKNSSFI